jgi:hypothetical protein
MNRPLSLLLAAFAESVSAGCASTPQSPTESLTSDILRGSSQNLTCPSGEVPSCMTNGTRINSVNPQRACECLVRELVIEGRYSY